MMKFKINKTHKRILIGVSVAILFVALLIPATFQRKPPIQPDELELITTKTILSIGQSGGFAIANDTVYYTDFEATVSNQCLSVTNNTYTALKEGSCILTVTFDGQTRFAEITVTANNITDERVFASPTGQRYHSTQKHGGKTAIEMSEEEALQSGKSPCKVCWK